MATPSPKRRSSPRQPAAVVAVAVDEVRGRRSPAHRRAVHHVVVDEGEGLQQLEGGAGVDDAGVVGVAARADEAPVAERRAQPLAAVEDEGAAASSSRSRDGGVERTPASDLVVEQRARGAPRPGPRWRPGSAAR